MISIIIVSYNTFERLAKTIDDITRSTKDIKYEIIVVDNASKDNTVEKIKLRYPDLKIIENRKNVFFSPALNQGAKIAKGEYYLLLNSDLSLTENSIKEMSKALEKNASIGAISPMIYDNDMKIRDFSWNQRSIMDLFIYRAPMSFFFKKIAQKKKVVSTKISENLYEVEIISDACMLIKAEVFKNIGGYDEKMLLYYTEDDLCIRIKKLGYKITVTELAKVYHECNFSTKKEKPLKILKLELNDRNKFYFKYYGMFGLVISSIVGYTEIIYFSLKLQGKQKF